MTKQPLKYSIDFMDIPAIGKHLDLWNQKETSREELAREHRAAQEPDKPNFVKDPKEWEQYTDKRREILHLRERLVEDDKILKDEQRNIHVAIMEAIPANTWVRIPFENQSEDAPDPERWVGYHTDDWPGYQSTLEVKYKVPEHALKHRRS